MHAFDMTQPLIQNDEVVYTQVEEEVVLMHPADGTYYGLNVVGAELWALFEEKSMTLKEITTYLQTTYALDESVAIADAQAFLEPMLREAFLVSLKA
ncbi:MAG: PqqD family protein [Legionellaceae bacterium]|nr:PqqD family protein [Legionellaceae bacterium]